MSEIPEELWKPLLTFALGAIGGGAIGFRFGKRQSIMGSGRLVDQAKANAGGDIVGGDKSG